MNQVFSEFIEIHQLRVGMFIELKLGWMSHPFPSGSFKISSEKQIEVIRGLGLTRVCYLPGKSDPAPDPVITPIPEADSTQPDGVLAAVEGAAPEPDAAPSPGPKRDALDWQQQELTLCERRFGEAIQQYRVALEQVDSKPQQVMTQCVELVSSFVNEMAGDGEFAIRLLCEGGGDRAFMHPVNVTVVSLLLGKALGLPVNDMVDLGVAAFLHDLGKSQLPDRVRWLEENFSAAEYRAYQQHVEQGVALGRRMQLSPGALQAIAQHHEMVDGSGFPSRINAQSMAMPAKILALVNRYDSLCNPARPLAAVTPHEALSLIFAQHKTRFDSEVLGAFIRMMGVYPPGSVVQLADERFALVVSVNSSRPLKPRVLVHEPGVPRHEALILDLASLPDMGIRRSLKPTGLPSAAMDYLAPRQRICYFFHQWVSPLDVEARS